MISDKIRITEVVTNSDIEQFEDVRLWGLYQNGTLVMLSTEFGKVQNAMFRLEGEGSKACRQVTVIADKTSETKISREVKLDS